MRYKLGEELKAPKFTMFMKYAQRMLERPTLKQTTVEVRIYLHKRLM